MTIHLEEDSRLRLSRQRHGPSQSRDSRNIGGARANLTIKGTLVPAALTGFRYGTDLFANDVDDIRLALDTLDASSRASLRCLQCDAADYGLARGSLYSTACRSLYSTACCCVRDELAGRCPSWNHPQRYRPVGRASDWCNDQRASPKLSRQRRRLGFAANQR